MNDLFVYLNNFIDNNNLDGLLFNSSDKFLSEYTALNDNSSYKLSNFSGSQSYLLYKKDRMFLFVDSRYHVQAEQETDKSLVEVIKVPLSVSPFRALVEIIPDNFKIGIPAPCVSAGFAEKLRSELDKKSSTVVALPHDIVEEYTHSTCFIDINFEQTDIEIAGKTSADKINYLRQNYGENFALIITTLDDCAYFTNLKSFNFPYSSSFPMKMIVSDFNVTIYSNIDYTDENSDFVFKYLDDFYNDLKNIKGKNVYISKNNISELDFSLIDNSNIIKESDFSVLKMIKNQSEINHLKYCFHQTDKALKIVEDMLNSDEIFTEFDYNCALVNSLYDNLARNLSFKPIVAAGTNSAIIHYSKADKTKKVNDGDFLLVDFGAYFDGGYATDTTRTFIKGTPTKEQKRVYTTVLRAFLNAYSNQSERYFDIDEKARTIIENELGNEYPFSHSTGHGVGINVHEVPPRLSDTELSKTPIVPDTVFSIEPGAYKENFGGVRLENTVFAKLTNNGIQLETLSKYKFEDKLVDKTLLNENELKWFNDWQNEYERNYVG